MAIFVTKHRSQLRFILTITFLYLKMGKLVFIDVVIAITITINAKTQYIVHVVAYSHTETCQKRRDREEAAIDKQP